jgi:hypothetical protein
MKLLKIQKSFKIFTDLKFALLVLGVLALASSLGSFIEQDEPFSFYEENYTIYSNSDPASYFPDNAKTYEIYVVDEKSLQKIISNQNKVSTMSMLRRKIKHYTNCG